MNPNLDPELTEKFKKFNEVINPISKTLADKLYNEYLDGAPAPGEMDIFKACKTGIQELNLTQDELTEYLAVYINSTVSLILIPKLLADLKDIGSIKGLL